MTFWAQSVIMVEAQVKNKNHYPFKILPFTQLFLYSLVSKMSEYASKTDLFSFQIKVWFDNWALCVSDGSRLRPPDTDGEGGSVRARRQQHGWRRPGQALVAQESQLWGEMLCQHMEGRLCVEHPTSAFSGSGISYGKDDKLSRCPRDWQ